MCHTENPEHSVNKYCKMRYVEPIPEEGIYYIPEEVIDEEYPSMEHLQLVTHAVDNPEMLARAQVNNILVEEPCILCDPSNPTAECYHISNENDNISRCSTKANGEDDRDSKTRCSPSIFQDSNNNVGSCHCCCQHNTRSHNFKQVINTDMYNSISLSDISLQEKDPNEFRHFRRFQSEECISSKRQFDNRMYISSNKYNSLFWSNNDTINYYLKHVKSPMTLIHGVPRLYSFKYGININKNENTQLEDKTSSNQSKSIDCHHPKGKKKSFMKRITSQITNSNHSKHQVHFEISDDYHWDYYEIEIFNVDMLTNANAIFDDYYYDHYKLVYLEPNSAWHDNLRTDKIFKDNVTIKKAMKNKLMKAVQKFGKYCKEHGYGGKKKYILDIVDEDVAKYCDPTVLKSIGYMDTDMTIHSGDGCNG